MKRICVYCGSSHGKREAYAEAARALATTLAARGIGLVYGGSSVGIMSEIADTMLAAGGEVIGIIPRALVDREVAHGSLTDLRIVDSMHERKGEMERLSDGFVALPGGLGTLEELFEMLTWLQLGLHGKPCGVLNIDGYFAPLHALLDHMVAEDFVKREHRDMLLTADTPAALLDQLEKFTPPTIDKWWIKE